MLAALHDAVLNCAETITIRYSTRAGIYHPDPRIYRPRRLSLASLILALTYRLEAAADC